MATALTIRVNYVDSDVAYATTPADYITMDLTNDKIYWTSGSSIVADLMTYAPSAGELNEAATIISSSAATTVPYCLLYDYSHNVGGSYYTHLVKGMSENKRYVFCFSFDGDTATEPTLEAWDDTGHTTTAKHVLGYGTPADSMVKAVCTTAGLPGTSWVGTALAGSTTARKLYLNNTNGALAVATDLYANIKIVVPQSYATPAVEAFTLAVRYNWS